MSAVSWPLQKALYARLSTASALSGLLGSVRLYDAAPQDATFPYITLHDLVARPWGSEECEHRAHFYVYDREGGGGRVRRIVGVLEGVLHEGSLDIEGHHLIHMRVLESDAKRLRDGKTWRGRILVRILTEPHA